ncbi:MAG: DUF359 domain-containing protein [Desulfurococcales archaeon]|nr:DUF359 domain-containing protein [Desulfurococcales archaeon]
MIGEPAYILPSALRFDFARPRGPVYSGDFTKHIDRSAPSVTCVGDVVSSYCSKGLKDFSGALLMVIDGKTRRTSRIDHSFNREEGNIWRVRNPPGTITWFSARLICRLLQEPTGRHLILVDGEEDMLALPSISCTPLGGYVIFGIPLKGAAVVRVYPWILWDAQNRLLSLTPRVV